MERIDLMTHCDSYTETEDELVSLLHLDSRQGLNRFMKSTSLDYKFLSDYVYRDIIAEEADNITPDNEDERLGNEQNFGEQS